MGLIEQYGTFWERNSKNMTKYGELVRSKAGGIYVLYSGSAPVYVGTGRIKSRVSRRTRKGSSKSRYWDHFSWFLINDLKIEREMEAFLLKVLPFYLRCLNRRTESLRGATNQNRHAESRLTLPHSLRRRVKS